MASRKEYTYQIKGNKLSLLEKDYSTSDGLNYSYSGVSGDGITDDIPSGTTVVQSPLSSVTDGIEIEYAYSPSYRINDTSSAYDKTSSAYSSAYGYLGLVVESMSAAAGSWIVVKGSDRWDGLHQVKDTISSSVALVLNTKYNGPSVLDASTLYHDVDVLNDESDVIDVPPYLSKALVYYVKAKVAEDQLNIEVKEYMMREFRKMLEKHENSKVAGPRMIMTGPTAIR